MAIHREPPYRDAPLPHGTYWPRWEERLPETAAAADETIILPLFHQMTEEEQDYVIGSIQEVSH
jgi:dTDP-4-amino-4,6-dideoxygalactose transaminase